MVGRQSPWGVDPPFHEKWTCPPRDARRSSSDAASSARCRQRPFSALHRWESRIQDLTRPGASANPGEELDRRSDRDCRIAFSSRRDGSDLAGWLSAAIPPDQAIPEDTTPEGVAESSIKRPLAELGGANALGKRSMRASLRAQTELGHEGLGASELFFASFPDRRTFV
jgi:hypothetical protein